jgi:hypothetical protein
LNFSPLKLTAPACHNGGKAHRPRDPNQPAKMVADIAKGEINDTWTIEKLIGKVL